MCKLPIVNRFFSTTTKTTVHTNISKSNFKKFGVTGGAWFRRLRRSQSCVPFSHLSAAVPPHTLLEQPGAALEQPGAAWGSLGPAWSSLEQPWSSPGAVLGWPWPDSLPKRPRKSPLVPFPSLPQKSSPKFSWSFLKKKWIKFLIYYLKKDKLFCFQVCIII